MTFPSTYTLSTTLPYAYILKLFFLFLYFHINLTVTLSKSRWLQLVPWTQGSLAAALSGTLSAFVHLLCLKLLLEKIFVQLLSLFVAACLFEHKYTESNVKLESNYLYVYTVLSQ